MSQLGQDVSAKDEKSFSQLHTVNVYHIVLRGMVLILVKFYFFCVITYNALGMHSQYSNEI